MDIGTQVWFDDGTNLGFLVLGTIVDNMGTMVKVKHDNDMYNVPSQSIKPADLNNAIGFDDMVKMRDLHEGSLLWNLKNRYHSGKIYTYIGNILVSVNPYRVFGIYGLETVRKYQGQFIGKLPPHIFAVAEVAFFELVKDRRNQVMVVSGESGSGKTESTKLCMQYLAAVNRAQNTLVTEKILEANPLLESFGNAKTIMNDNSSRFGKYIEIFFDRDVISGAKVSEYLLEKSRIVYQNPGDRNFHIFYEMIAGLPAAEKSSFGLTKPNDFFYLDQGSSSVISQKNDANDFQHTLSAMEILGISKEEKKGILSILAAILHLGNIYYGRTQLNGQEAAVIMNEADVGTVARLLHVEPEGVALLLTNRVTEAAGEKFYSPLNIERALDARDAISRALYSLLFGWLVTRINQSIHQPEDENSTSIAILDIFGFEDFKSNSFEQFCINFANESLQSFFVDHVFKQEQEEYRQEKIQWNVVSFVDNQECLDLICKPPFGIVHILGDESNFPQSTDRSFLDKCHQQFTRHKHYKRPKTGLLQFGIIHYAGLVMYQADMFLDKNRDNMRMEMVELFSTSKSPIIASLFAEKSRNGTTQANSSLSSSSFRLQTNAGSQRRSKFNMGRVPTVAGGFSDSLAQLVTKMKQCNPFFIRCLRPNTEKSPNLFQDSLIMNQLKCSGMLETIRIRKSGFPVRMSFENFIQRYRCIYRGQLKPHLSAQEKCSELLLLISNGKAKHEFATGITKIFLREDIEKFLEESRYITLRNMAVRIQKNVRRWFAQRSYRRKKGAALIIQRNYRGFLARARYRKALHGIVLFQSLWRIYRKRQLIEKRKYDISHNMPVHEKKQVDEMLQLETRRETDVTHLEIPVELAVVFSKQQTWQSFQNEYDFEKVEKVIVNDRIKHGLPSDIDNFPFSKFVQQFFQDDKSFHCVSAPIYSPFLKLKNSEASEAVRLFRLILRFMGDASITASREVILGNYIILIGIKNVDIRDEMYTQICNQIWSNGNEASQQRGWLLVSLCLSCFPPSALMYKYLLKYVSKL